MQPKNYSISEVFNNTSIGLKYEFYSSKNPNFIVEDLAKATSKTVMLTGDKKISPSWSTAILVQEFNGKRPRYQFKLAPQDYMSIGPALHSVLAWINEEAVLDYSTKLQVSLLFKNYHLQTLSTIANMEVSKMILKIDESKLYNMFPEMKVSPFSLSVKHIVPFDGFINNSINLSTLNTSFRMPISESYAIDFTEQNYGILKFNYIGGSEYAKNGEYINEALKYYILSTYQVLNTDMYTQDMQYELNKITENYSKLRQAYYEPEFFLKEFKDIKLSVDLIKNVQTIKTYWAQLRTPLFKLMVETNLKKGSFNYNLDESKFELKDAKLKGTRINNLCLVNCEIEGLIENCSLWRCQTKNSRLTKSYLITGNKIESSLLESCKADTNNKIEKSYILNSGEIINCIVNESIIINAGLGSLAKLDEECTLVDLTNKVAPPIKPGIKSEEIRDYKWIKQMNKSEPKGFGNEYKSKY